MIKFNLNEALMGADVITRDGTDVTEIVHLKTLTSGHRVVAVINGYANSFSEDGRRSNNFECELDLFMKPKTVWVNLYLDFADSVNEWNGKVRGWAYLSKEKADVSADESSRVACVEVSVENQFERN